jgi:DNA-binding MarR family transcriptional regulator
MHGVSFGVKRAHWGAVRLANYVVGGIGLTAARFDVLYLVDSGVVSQAALRAKLGIARSTMSRMVRRLVELGLVERERCGRTWAVSLTREGLRRIRRGIREAVASGLAQMAYESIFETQGWAARLRVWDLEDAVLAVARRFGDTSEQFYLSDHPEE